jgi:hypothetical protein
VPEPEPAEGQHRKLCEADETSDEGPDQGPSERAGECQ